MNRNSSARKIGARARKLAVYIEGASGGEGREEKVEIIIARFDVVTRNELIGH